MLMVGTDYNSCGPAPMNIQMEEKERCSQNNEHDN